MHVIAAYRPVDDPEVIQQENPELTMPVDQRYIPHRRHPELFEGTFQPCWLDERFLQIVERFRLHPEGADQWDLAELTTDLQQSGLGFECNMEEVYSFPVFSELFVELLNQEICRFNETGLPAARPNSMNNHGIIVNQIGMRPMITAFQQEYLLPITRVLFSDIGYQFDDHHSFTVRYQKGEDRGLDMHTDDSDVTFNVCLGEEFTGATLAFCGMIAQKDHRKLKHVYNHQIGDALCLADSAEKW